jgi:hypothetical protein
MFRHAMTVGGSDESDSGVISDKRSDSEDYIKGRTAAFSEGWDDRV